MRNQLIHPKVKPLTNLDLSLPDNVLKLMAAPAKVDFSAPNKLFNPMPWQKAADGHLIKVDDTNIGPNAVTITKMVPLYLKLTLDEVTTTDSGRAARSASRTKPQPASGTARNRSTARLATRMRRLRCAT